MCLYIHIHTCASIYLWSNTSICCIYAGMLSMYRWPYGPPSYISFFICMWLYIRIHTCASMYLWSKHQILQSAAFMQVCYLCIDDHMVHHIAGDGRVIGLNLLQYILTNLYIGAHRFVLYLCNSCIHAANVSYVS